MLSLFLLELIYQHISWKIKKVPTTTIDHWGIRRSKSSSSSFFCSMIYITRYSREIELEWQPIEGLVRKINELALFMQCRVCLPIFPKSRPPSLHYLIPTIGVWHFYAPANNNTQIRSCDPCGRTHRGAVLMLFATRGVLYKHVAKWAIIGESVLFDGISVSWSLSTTSCDVKSGQFLRTWPWYMFKEFAIK